MQLDWKLRDLVDFPKQTKVNLADGERKRLEYALLENSIQILLLYRVSKSTYVHYVESINPDMASKYSAVVSPRQSSDPGNDSGFSKPRQGIKSHVRQSIQMQFVPSPGCSAKLTEVRSFPDGQS